MSWVEPADTTSGVLVDNDWGDAVNTSFDWLRGAKAGCRLSSVAGTATGTDTKLPWATEVYDVNGCHDTGSNTERITVPSGWDGLWYVGCEVEMTSGLFTLNIVVNNTTRICGQSSNTSGATDSACSCATVYEMAVGDYFEVWCTGGTSRQTGTPSYFFAHWLNSDS